MQPAVAAAAAFQFQVTAGEKPLRTGEPHILKSRQQVGQLTIAAGAVAGGLGRDAALGQWIDIAIGADWRMAGGWTEILVRPEGAADWQSVAWDDGMNTSTGHVFFKFGLYRSFLERDPGLADRPARALFRTPVRGTDPRTVLGLAAAG